MVLCLILNVPPVGMSCTRSMYRSASTPVITPFTFNRGLDGPPPAFLGSFPKYIFEEALASMSCVAPFIARVMGNVGNALKFSSLVCGHGW